MLVGNLIQQILFPWVNKYGKKVRQNLFSQRKPHSIPDSGTKWKLEMEIKKDNQAQCEEPKVQPQLETEVE